MERGLIIASVVVGVLMTALVLSVFTIYEVDRTLLGLPPKIDTTKKDTVIPKVEVELPRLEKLEHNLISQARIKRQRDSANKNIKHLKDSLKNVFADINHMQDSLKKLLAKIESRNDTNNRLSDSINRLNSDIVTANNRLEQSKKQLMDTEKFFEQKIDTAEYKNFVTFAKIYDKTNPTEVAKILEQLDERDAAIILKLMQKKKAGKVIEALEAETAAAILLLGSEY